MIIIVVITIITNLLKNKKHATSPSPRVREYGTNLQQSWVSPKLRIPSSSGHLQACLPPSSAASWSHSSASPLLAVLRNLCLTGTEVSRVALHLHMVPREWHHKISEFHSKTLSKPLPGGQRLRCLSALFISVRAIWSREEILLRRCGQVIHFLECFQEFSLCLFLHGFG